MAKLRITFDVDTGTLFDSIAVMNGDWSPLVQRMAGVMMTGEMGGFANQVGMAFYGIEVVSVDRPVTDPTDGGGNDD